jgi:hypothetical protein
VLHVKHWHPPEGSRSHPASPVTPFNPARVDRRQRTHRRIRAILRQGFSDSAHSVGAICAALFRAEARTGLWLKLFIVSLCASAILLVAPIPFWDRSVTLTAIGGVNVALTVITISISIYYDTCVSWASELPRSRGWVLSAMVASRVVTAAAALLAASLAEAVLFWLLPGGTFAEARRLLVATIPACCWCAIVLVPWAILARLALGRTAAPWLVLGVALASTRLPAASFRSLAAALAWVLPAIPVPDSHLESSALFVASSWLYAIIHAACITALAMPLLRRPR